MISNYEIRENSLTRNSIFLLLVKADEQGCEDIKRELSSYCNLIDAKVKNFDYVFELSGITDDSMLDKLKSRLEVMSSFASGISQTFENMDQTATIDIESTTVKSNQDMDSVQEKANMSKLKEEDVPLSLANTGTGFSVTQEQGENIDFSEVPADSTLVSGDEKRIEIEGDSSLRLAQTIPTMKQSLPSILDVPKNDIEEQPKQQEQLKKLSAVEEENKTIVAYSDEEIKNVSISLEKEKTGLFGGFLGKIKSAMHSKQNNQKETVANTPKEQKTLSGLIKGASHPEPEEKSFRESQELSEKEETNPFQDLGEGIIVKKGLLEEETKPVKQDKRELSANSITAKLQVDDIFAAETVCDFYAGQPGEQKQEQSSFSETRKTPLDALEKSNVREDITEPVELSAPNEEKTLPTKTKDSELNITQKISEAQNEQTKSKKGLTSPNQIFTRGDLSKEEDSLKRGKVSSANEIKKEESLPKIEPIKTSKQSVIVKKEQQIVQGEKKKEEPQIRPLQTKEEKNMNEEKKDRPVVSKQKANTSNLVGGMRIPSNKQKTVAKIDHTLHVATPAKAAKYRNYPIEMPLIPTYTFANMDISSIRFAHALAMATLDDLGKSNNPFLLQGTSGTGKTHFLHAMGYEISKKISQSKILFTNGVRLSRGVQYLLERGQKDKLDVFFGNAEVLIIDDVHLTAVNEHNREYISKILNDFLKNKKQIIMSSKYPPESLKRFEELVNFKFSLGTIAELKVPNKNHFVRLTNKIVSESFLDLTEQQIQTFFSDQNDSLGDVARSVKRVKVLSRRIESSGIKKMSYEDIIKEMTAINGENENSEIAKKDFEEITALERNKEGSWGNFGFFFPTSQIDKFRWVAFAAQEAAKDLGIKGGFNYALKSAYSTEHIISAAFKIANICDLKGLKGAVILGPAFVECKEPIRDNFYDILTHMLEVMMIRCGTINFEDIKKPSAYVKMLGDILK